MPDLIKESCNAIRNAEPVDAVYTWVNATDPKTAAGLEELRAHHPEHQASDALGTQRFRDNDELRYSLRSLAQHAPWIRNVFIVTNGQVPHWLNIEHPNLTIVTHAELNCADLALPTFNSNAIELALHTIPGLSQRFLYLNDDLFLGTSTTPGTFITDDGRQHWFLEDMNLPAEQHCSTTHDRSYAYTQRILHGSSSPAETQSLPAHTPQLYDRMVIGDVARTHQAEVARTLSHRFRSPDDLVLRIAYMSSILDAASDRKALPVTLGDNLTEYIFARFRDSGWANLRLLARIARWKPRFFCINDEVEASVMGRASLRALPGFLALMFPRTSPYERATRHSGP